MRPNRVIPVCLAMITGIGVSRTRFRRDSAWEDETTGNIRPRGVRRSERQVAKTV